MVKLGSILWNARIFASSTQKCSLPGRMSMTLFDIWQQVGLAVGDIDNIQRHARMDRYVAQVTLSSANFVSAFFTRYSSQTEDFGCVSSQLPPYNWRLPSQPSSVQEKVDRYLSTPLPPFSGKKDPFHPPLPTPSIVQRCEDPSTQSLRKTIAWRAQRASVSRRRPLDTLEVFQ